MIWLAIAMAQAPAELPRRVETTAWVVSDPPPMAPFQQLVVVQMTYAGAPTGFPGEGATMGGEAVFGTACSDRRGRPQATCGARGQVAFVGLLPAAATEVELNLGPHAITVPLTGSGPLPDGARPWFVAPEDALVLSVMPTEAYVVPVGPKAELAYLAVVFDVTGSAWPPQLLSTVAHLPGGPLGSPDEVECTSGERPACQGTEVGDGTARAFWQLNEAADEVAVALAGVQRGEVLTVGSSGPPLPLGLAAAALAQEGRLSAASIIIEQALAADPDDTTALGMAASIYARMGNHLAVVQCLDALLAADPSATEGPKGRSLMGVYAAALVDVGRYADAIRIIDQVGPSAPSDWGLEALRARAVVGAR